MSKEPVGNNSLVEAVTEAERIRERYARRKTVHSSYRYDYFLPSLYLCHQERERAIIRCLDRFGIKPLHDKRLLEIGCGSGFNLQQFIHMGFSPENVVGNELLEDEAERARQLLPSATAIISGDALELELPDASFDVVVFSTVMSSILDDSFQEALAAKAWSLVRPGGGILWYDFVIDNPRNRDVRGVPLRRVHQLFNDGSIHSKRLTLAPPLSRIVTRLHPSFYTLFNSMPFLRTHVLCWIAKSFVTGRILK